MILTIWVILLALSLIILAIGKYIQQEPLLLTGFMFMFLLGLTLMLGFVQYQTGEVKTLAYSNSTLINETTTYSYTTYSGEVVMNIQMHHVFGLFFSLVSAFGFILTLFTLRAEGWSF